MALVSQQQGGIAVAVKPSIQSAVGPANLAAQIAVTTDVFSIPIKVYKVPSTANPFLCIVRLPNQWFVQGYQYQAASFYLKYGSNSFRFIRKDDKQNTSELNKNRTRQHTKGASPKAEGIVLLDQFSRYQVCNIDSTKTVEFWVNSNGNEKKFLNIEYETMEDYVYVEDMDTEVLQHIIDNFQSPAGFEIATLSTILGYMPTINFSKDIQITKTDQGLSLSLPNDPSLKENIKASIYYKNSTSDKNEFYGIIEPNSQYPFRGDGLFSFRKQSFSGQHAVRTSQFDHDYVHTYSPVRSESKAQPRLPIFVQTGSTEIKPIQIEGLNTGGWDRLWITHNAGEKVLFPYDSIDSGTFNVSVYDDSIAIELSKVWGPNYTVFHKTSVTLEKHWDKQVSNLATIQEVSPVPNNPGTWELEVLLQKPKENLAQYEGVNFHSIKNDTWRDSIYQGKNVLYLSVNSFGTDRTSEIAFMNLGYKKNEDESTGTFVDNISASNLTLTDIDSESVLMKFNITIPSSPKNYLVFRLHKFTAGIDHVFRQKQDHRVQEDNGNTSGSKVRKYRSIFDSEHPSVLNRGRIVPFDFNKLPRALSGSPDAIIREVPDIAEGLDDTSSPMEYTTLSLLQNVGNNKIFRARFVRIKKIWSPSEKSQSKKIYLRFSYDSRSYLIAEFNTAFDVDHWVFLHPEISEKVAGVTSWNIKLGGLQAENETIKVGESEFITSDIFLEMPVTLQDSTIGNANLVG